MFGLPHILGCTIGAPSLLFRTVSSLKKTRPSTDLELEHGDLYGTSGFRRQKTSASMSTVIDPVRSLWGAVRFKSARSIH
jgi:hypothetical protein